MGRTAGGRLFFLVVGSGPVAGIPGVVAGKETAFVDGTFRCVYLGTIEHYGAFGAEHDGLESRCAI